MGADDAPARVLGEPRRGVRHVPSELRGERLVGAEDAVRARAAVPGPQGRLVVGAGRHRAVRRRGRGGVPDGARSGGVCAVSAGGGRGRGAAGSRGRGDGCANAPSLDPWAPRTLGPFAREPPGLDDYALDTRQQPLRRGRAGHRLRPRARHGDGRVLVRRRGPRRHDRRRRQAQARDRRHVQGQRPNRPALRAALRLLPQDDGGTDGASQGRRRRLHWLARDGGGLRHARRRHGAGPRGARLRRGGLQPASGRAKTLRGLRRHPADQRRQARRDVQRGGAAGVSRPMGEGLRQGDHAGAEGPRPPVSPGDDRARVPVLPAVGG